jgi:SNF2 family DNA or RNA helicase
MEEMREILPELPAAAVITKERLDFETEEEGDFYRGIQGIIKRRFKALDHDNSNAMFVLLMRLRQLSLHPQVYINARKKEWVGYNRDDWEGSSTKFSVLRNKIHASPTPARWIVFCQFHDEMDILQAYLSASPEIGKVWQYHGGMTDKAKAEVLEDTNTPLADKHQVLLLQLQSGGVGLNLQHFTKIIFMSPWWTAALMDQAIGRAVRIGQEEVVEVTLLVLKEEESMNIDEKMLAKAETKRGMLEKLFQYASRGKIVSEEPVDDDASEASTELSVDDRAPLVAVGGAGEDPN